MKLRELHLNREPLCRECMAPGEVVDHIIRINAGGKRDDPDNLQTLCSSCHNIKRGKESQEKQFSIPVTLVCGPPGAGKTFHVEQKRAAGDIIVDLDAIKSAITGMPWYYGDEDAMPFVFEARDAIIKRLYRPTVVRRAWVIGSCPQRLDRQIYESAGAKVVILDVPPEICEQRIRADSRRANQIKKWIPIIRQWWYDYERDE